MACAQNDCSMGVSEAAKPICDLNHWRSVSTKLINAIGVWQMEEANVVRSSKSFSAAVSSILYERSDANRSFSFKDRGVELG